MSTHAQERRRGAKSKADSNLVPMKIFVYLNIETAIRNEHCLGGPEVHECLRASFMRSFVTNALPAVGNKLAFADGVEITRRFRKSGLTAPEVIDVRQVMRRGVLDHEVVYKQRVELTGEEVNLPMGHHFGPFIIDTETCAINALEISHFHEVICPLLEKEGFVFRTGAKENHFPKCDIMDIIHEK